MYAENYCKNSIVQLKFLLIFRLASIVVDMFVTLKLTPTIHRVHVLNCRPNDFEVVEQ